MNVRPLRDMVVVRLLPDDKPQGLVVGVELYDRPSVHAQVIACGPEVRDTKPGDRVVVSRLQGIAIDVGEPVLLMREAAVLATV